MSKIKALWKDRKNQATYTKWLMSYTKPYLGRIILMMVLNLITTGVSLYMAILSKRIIDDAIAGDRSNALLLVGVYFLLIIGMEAISILSTLVSTMLNERFSFGIRKQLYDKIINSHWMDVKKYHTGDLMTRLTADINNISDGIIWTIPEILRLTVELVAVFFTLFYFSPLLAVLALMIGPIATFIAYWLGRKLKRLQVKVQESEAAYRSFLQESLENLLIVKSFTNEKYAIQRLVELRENRFHWVLKKTKFGVVSSAAMSLSFQVGYILAFAYGATQIAAKAISYGTMSLFLTLVNRVQAPVLMLPQQIPKIVLLLTSVGRVLELQNVPLEEKSELHMEKDSVGVSIDNLSFGYTKELVLDGANIQINPGERVAILGESGIGKTTLIRLLMSFMKNTSGTICFTNNNGEREEATAGTREYISYVPQGNTLFSGTIRENIQMGKQDATEEEIIKALKMASAYEFVMGLPDGLDTRIGERGHGLSEGQAQRIAIARAFVRNAPFLILDEATSALDEKTEISVLDGLKKLNPMQTCLIITHRRSILKFCDRELRINDKKIEEVAI